MSDNDPTTHPRTRRIWRPLAGGTAAALLVVGLLAYINPFATPTTTVAGRQRSVPPCESPTSPLQPGQPGRGQPAPGQPAPGQPAPGQPELKPTTVTTIGQAYYCVFDNYYRGPVLDSRALLVPAFAALTQELQRRGLDRAEATLPALTGEKDADWVEFSRVYERINAKLPADVAVRQVVAEASMRAMVDSLHDNHARWARGFQQNTSGLLVSAYNGPGHLDPAARAPLYVTRVDPGGPGAAAGVKPGDEIMAVNGVPPYVNGVLSQGVLDLITSGAEGAPLKLTLRRPATKATVPVTVIPASGAAPAGPEVTSKLVDGDLAYVRLPAFASGLADKVLAAIAELRKQANLRGVILDVRGNGGGSPDEVWRLLGALTHGKVVSYWCDVRDRCTGNHADDSVQLLELPLVELTDRGCASACDSFSSAVRDLNLGKLVGTRTAGAVSGPALPYRLDDGSAINLPRYHEIAANKEVVDTVGVAPDHYAPLTAADLSTGRDPGVDKARELLKP